MGHDPLKKRKIAVLGARSVVVQFVEGHFVESYYPTIENTFTKSIKFKNTEYDCDIIDTAGQDEYSILNNKHAIGIHGYILVYSVASLVSFDMIQIIHDKILTYSGTQTIPCVIVGQKKDLVNARQVPTAEAQKLAARLGCAFIETSARDNVNVADAFDMCLSQIEQSTNPSPDNPSRCVIM
ncbi:GTP-binding protein rhb1 [Ceratobasidium theobromae]|uniref:GTP-binding protein rhb1 n=1 Tax=Ceratobasidium theobromae TaxID=1582974 RepID=A0A5N5QN13_9AGAM|nr:GTP-binding protein rhb1 [Ceratobasidium theobromae]